jgi:hypothetical protein
MGETFRGQDLALAFFSELKDHLHRDWKDNVDQMVCLCLNVQKKPAPGAGYTNLAKHVTNKHTNEEIVAQMALITEANTSSQTTVDAYFLPPPKALWIYGWIDWMERVQLCRACGDTSLHKFKSNITKYARQVHTTSYCRCRSKVESHFVSYTTRIGIGWMDREHDSLLRTVCVFARR